MGNLAGVHDLLELPAGVKFDPTDEELLEHLKAKVTGKDHRLIHNFIPTLEEENGICYTHPEGLPGVSKDGQIRHFFHQPSRAYSTGTRKRSRIHTDDDGREARWHITGNIQPVVIGGTVKGFKKILLFDAHYECHQYHLGNNEEKEGELVVSKVFYMTQPHHYGSGVRDSIGRKMGASFLKDCWNGIKGSLSIASNALAKVKNLFNESALQASEQEQPHEHDDANSNRRSGFYSFIDDESIPKRRKPSQSKSDDRNGSLLSTPDHSHPPNQTATGETTKGQRMQAQIPINSAAQNLIKPGSNHTIVELHRWDSGSVSRSDMVPASSAPSAEAQPWGSSSHTSLSKPAQPVAFGRMNSASSTGHNSSLGSRNRAGSLPQIGLLASAPCRPKVQQPFGSDFRNNQNAALRPAAQDQNPYWGQVAGNPKIEVGGQPGNQNATPRPVDQNQEPNCPRVGIGSCSVTPSVIVHSAGSSTININNGNTYNFSPQSIAYHESRNHNPI
ncbi:hypothetical protein SLEP1_g31058 [Rubroshorea leprosula]|uniref:NAC domain-containing protein n=1 Tax=Rubroshorea leprosula TaxID=152421 RepID=A0AAV5K277_9ROSI|nr:hypothetical protein SLEP1_g31058 [Rubroshorea leprosula]